jgi:hypothetical protein
MTLPFPYVTPETLESDGSKLLADFGTLFPIHNPWAVAMLDVLDVLAGTTAGKWCMEEIAAKINTITGAKPPA